MFFTFYKFYKSNNFDTNAVSFNGRESAINNALDGTTYPG